MFSSCCGIDDSDSDHSTHDPCSHATSAGREPLSFCAINYDQAHPQTRPYNDVDAASNATTRSSQLSPRATPSHRREPSKDLTTSTTQEEAAWTPVKNYGTTQSVSTSVYSQPSQPRTPPSASTVRYVGRQEESGQVVHVANGEQTSEEPGMDEIPKLMRDEEGKK